MIDEDITPELASEAKPRLKWIIYKEKEILIQDYTGLQGDDIARIMPAMTDQIIKTGKKDILNIVDIRDSFGNKAAVNAFIKYSKIIRHLLKKTAALGVTGVKKVLLNTIDKFSSVGVKTFNSDQEAKEWLIS